MALREKFCRKASPRERECRSPYRSVTSLFTLSKSEYTWASVIWSSGCRFRKSFLQEVASRPVIARRKVYFEQIAIMYLMDDSLQGDVNAEVDDFRNGVPVAIRLIQLRIYIGVLQSVESENIQSLDIETGALQIEPLHPPLWKIIAYLEILQPQVLHIIEEKTAVRLFVVDVLPIVQGRVFSRTGRGRRPAF